MTLRAMLSASVAALATATAAAAECPADATGSVRILSNDFGTLNLIAERAMECATDSLEVTANQSTEHTEIQLPALTADPAEYTAVIAANGSFTSLLTAGLIRPLDDLVAEYGQELQESQLIRVDGQIMAVAFMANAEHFFYRKDVLEQAGVEPPQTWDEVLAAAEAIRSQGIMENPIALAYAPGWELGQGFVNLYLGAGGELFEPGTANATIDNEQGVQALEMMKALTGYMDPDYLTFSSSSLVPMFEAGEIAMSNFWGSEANEVLPGTDKAPTVAPNMALQASPTMAGGTHPATTVWWDGFTLARNVPDEDAEASFRVMMHAISPEIAQEHGDMAVWLVSGYEPTPAAQGVIASVQGGAPSYPTTPYMGLLHTAIDANIAEFLQGEESAEQALADATAAYEVSAREAGFLQ